MWHETESGLSVPYDPSVEDLESQFMNDWVRRILSNGERYLDIADDERIFLCSHGLIHLCHQSETQAEPAGGFNGLYVENVDATANPYWRGSTMALIWDDLVGPDERVDLRDSNPRWRVQGIRLLPHLIEGQITRLDDFMHRPGVIEQFFTIPAPTHHRLGDENEIDNAADFKEMSYLANLYIEMSFKSIVASIHDVRPEPNHRVDELWGIDPGKCRTPMNEAARSAVVKYLQRIPFFRYTEFKINGVKTRRKFPDEDDIAEYLHEMASQYSRIKYLGFEPNDGDAIELAPTISLRIAIAACYAAVELARDTGEAGDGS